MTVQQAVADRPAFDSDDFAEFYATYSDMVYRVLRVRGASRVDAEDLTHDVLLKVWPYRHTFDSVEHERRYVLLAAINMLTDLRRRTAMRAVPTELIDLLPARGVVDPETHALRAETNTELWAALGTLSPQDRQLLIDTDIHDFSDEELALAYACSENTLRQRRFRSRRRLQARLAPLASPAPVLARRVLDRIRAAGRGVSDVVRAGGRAVQEMTSTLLSHPQPITVMITTLTMVAAPYGGPLGAPPAAASEPPTWSRPGPSAPLFGPTRPAERIAEPGHGLGESAPAPRPRLRRVMTPLIVTAPDDPTDDDVPVCVEPHCPDNQDVVTAHLPAPIGDKGVGTDIAPVCSAVNQAPDVGVVSCHTEGDPTYRVPPRQRVE